MKSVDYLTFDKISPRDFLPLLNSQKIRKHLIAHPLFTIETLSAWMNTKIDLDDTPGCRVSAIACNGELAGWCGLQLEDGKYEIAIIIDDRFWGLGKQVFQELMGWAKELGHEAVSIHFLHTRPEYKFLKKIARKTYETVLFGQKFTTHQLAVI